MHTALCHAAFGRHGARRRRHRLPIMTKKQKKTRNRIIIVLIMFTALLILNWTGALDGIPWWGKALACLVPYLIIGYDIILKAAKNIRNGQVFDENFLMMVATFGAFGIGEYFEALAVMLFYQIGELFQPRRREDSAGRRRDRGEFVPRYCCADRRIGPAESICRRHRDQRLRERRRRAADPGGEAV